MPDGGLLRFRAGTCAALPAELRAELDDPSPPPAQFVAIAISDSGSGMTDDVKERAFEPFFTTKDVGRGTGLGLSTVYGFVKQSNGAITIDSTPGAGTTLTLYIPEPREVAVAPAAASAIGHAVPPGLRVLLVEDDEEVRTIVRTFLETLGCRVSATSNAEDALAVLHAGADIDLLLSDIALGTGMRGTELAARAEQRMPSLAVLLMSGFSAELLEADSASPASWELLRKPCSREELAQAIGAALGARQASGG
jgi:CheY-like chemotaxis protein